MDKLDIPMDVSALIGWLAQIATLLSPFGADSRLHWTGLTVFLLLGTAVFFADRRRARSGHASLAGFLFPMALYRTRSSWVDVKVYLAGRLLKPVMGLVTLTLRAMVTTACAAVVSGAVNGSDKVDPGIGVIVIASILVALLHDFGYYVTHRLFHESALLWPFHKLHHSAEVLTPITAKRNHPVFDLANGVIGIVLTAPVAGIVFGLFGVLQFTTIFGLALMIAIMNLSGGALRHSHIWLDFGPFMDRIFISPAQHQIHHSLEPRHHDRNYGLTLAVWDWMFGTLYIPQGRENLTFGVADREGNPLPQVHNSLAEAYMVPFGEAAEAVRQHRRSLAGEHA
jgi:sterol desaturase/sphingolipid hydroxylase (fatty acid hydroxylase superfamily)